jgi:predicted metal-binding membrane protein
MTLGPFWWFLGIWVVMMAAMMLPSTAPTVAAYTRLAPQRTAAGPLFFVVGYLAVWTAAGVLAFGLSRFGSHLVEEVSWAAGATLLLAALYQLTPLKDACLGRCRSPVAFLLGSWRPGAAGALRMGATHGAWCAGCCWALMASLFALGVMSIGWMAFVAGLVAVEKLLPWRRVALGATTAILGTLGVFLLV